MAREYCGNSPEVSVDCPPGYIGCCVVEGTETHTSCLVGDPDPPGSGGPGSSGPNFNVNAFTQSLLNLLSNYNSVPIISDEIVKDLRKALTRVFTSLDLGEISLVFHPDSQMRSSIHDSWEDQSVLNIWLEIISSQQAEKTIKTKVLEVKVKPTKENKFRNM